MPPAADGQRDRSPRRILVERASRGDREAFDALVRELRPQLASFVERKLGVVLRRRVEPDDIVQDTLVVAFERMASFEWRGERSFLRWLFRIAEHLIWNASRKRANEPSESPIEPISLLPTPSRTLRRGERLDRLQKTLAELRPDYREVIRLSRIERLKTREIAECMRRSEGAVKVLLFRALDELRRIFGDTESLTLPDDPWIEADDDKRPEADEPP